MKKEGNDSKTQKLLRLLIGDSDTREIERIRLPWMYRGAPCIDQLEAEIAAAMKEAEVREALKILKRNRFLEIRRAGNVLEARLTDKGITASLMERMRHMRKKSRDTVLMVSFDIPEQERSKRELFRQQMKRIGLKQKHASLWVTDKAIADSLVAYISRLEVGRWITLYEAKILTDS